MVWRRELLYGESLEPEQDLVEWVFDRPEIALCLHECTGGRVEKSLDAPVTAKRPNQTAPVNAPVPSGFNSALSWRRVTEQSRSML